MHDAEADEGGIVDSEGASWTWEGRVARARGRCSALEMSRPDPNVAGEQESWQQQGDGDVRAGGRCWMDLVDGEWFEGEGLAQNLTSQQRARGMTANPVCSLPGT